MSYPPWSSANVASSGSNEAPWSPLSLVEGGREARQSGRVSGGVGYILGEREREEGRVREGERCGLS